MNNTLQIKHFIQDLREVDINRAEHGVTYYVFSGDMDALDAGKKDDNMFLIQARYNGYNYPGCASQSYAEEVGRPKTIHLYDVQPISPNVLIDSTTPNRDHDLAIQIPQSRDDEFLRMMYPDKPKKNNVVTLYAIPYEQRPAEYGPFISQPRVHDRPISFMSWLDGQEASKWGGKSRLKTRRNKRRRRNSMRQFYNRRHQ